MNIIFNIHDGENTRQVTQDELKEYADYCGLNNLASGRYSSLFVVNLMLLEWCNDIDPFHVISEIEVLEGRMPSVKTKPESEFRGDHLKGLWHKHFMPALPSVVAHNIINHLGKNGTRTLVEDVLDPGRNPVITSDMLDELTHRIVVESLEKRADQEKLTGEWIVYAKEARNNYYLGIWRHDSGDENIAKSIKSVCVPEFSFLSKYFS